jgi:hypothetical protein
MRIIIGTGGCGFQRINTLLNTLGQGTSFKIMPRKMQNSFEIDYGKFIDEKLSNPNGILIGSFYLKNLENTITNKPNVRVLCLRGDKEKTVESLMIHWGFRNPLIKDRSKYSRYNLNFFDDYSGMDNRESICKYYDEYYSEVERLQNLFPNIIKVINSKDYFDNEEIQRDANIFINVNGSVIETKYSVKDSGVVTTSLHGGLGNNLFQIIEPLVFAEINGLSEPEFKTWDCSLLPVCNNSDIILGGHGGSWENFNNAFKNVTFTETETADFDTKFVINDMFDFQILHKYRNIIIDKFEPSEQMVSYITKKHGHLLKDSCSLHIRTWNSKGDVHDMPLKGDYYVKALAEIENKNILVFTDSIKHCKETLHSLMGQYPDKEFHLIDEDQFVSLFMIAMCENNIVNISTFSFWGAYLNKKQPNNKTVVPSNFGHPPNMLCYDEWIKV